MANWTNVRLIAVGSRDAVAAFAAASHDPTRRIFRPDMLYGEAHPPRRDRMERVAEGVHRKQFRLQARNGAGIDHFARVSKRYRRLTFIVVFGDPNADVYGSARIRRGETEDYHLPRRTANAVWRKHKVTLEDDDDWRFWEASWELMDIAEAHWSITRPQS